MNKNQMTLYLTDSDVMLLRGLAQSKGVTKSAILRQSMKLYAEIAERIKRGEKFYVQRIDGESIELVIVL